MNKKWVFYFFSILLIVGVGFVFYILFETPVLRMNGDNEMDLEVFSEYVEEGATARTMFQNLDSKVTISGDVDTSKVGTYKITYTVSGITSSARLMRFVNVVDRTAPEIHLKGESEIHLCPGKEYVDEGAVATDEYDGDLTKEIGVYKEEGKLVYKVKDSSSNEATLERILIQEDSEAPMIILNGREEIHLKVGSTYEEKGVLVMDNCDVIEEVEKEGTVDTSKKGTYLITYKAKDASGNEAEKERTIIVE